MSDDDYEKNDEKVNRRTIDKKRNVTEMICFKK